MPNRIDVLPPKGADLLGILKGALDVLQSNRVAVTAAAQMINGPSFGRIILARAEEKEQAVRLLAAAGFQIMTSR